MKPKLDKVVTVYLTTSEGQARGVGRDIGTRTFFVETGLLLPSRERMRVTFAGEDGTEMTALCEVRYHVALLVPSPRNGTPTKRHGLGLRVVAWETTDSGAPRLPH